MTAYYSTLEIVQHGKCFRCDLPYKSSKKDFVLKEAINHMTSVLSKSFNEGLIDMSGMTAKEFATEIVTNEKDGVEKYDLSFQLSIDNWKSIPHPTFFPCQHRLNLLDGETSHVEYVENDTSWKLK